MPEGTGDPTGAKKEDSIMQRNFVSFTIFCVLAYEKI